MLVHIFHWTTHQCKFRIIFYKIIQIFVYTSREAKKMLRKCNHRFPCEHGRWQGLDINERKCTLCNCLEVGDEFHYLLACSFFSSERKRYIEKRYYSNPNILKYKELMYCTDERRLKNLCVFAKILIKNVQWHKDASILLFGFSKKHFAVIELSVLVSIINFFFWNFYTVEICIYVNICLCILFSFTHMSYHMWPEICNKVLFCSYSPWTWI